MSYARYTKKRITKKQRAFIEMYVYEDLNQSQCAFRAGYKHPEIIANRLLHNPNYKHVQDKVKALQAKQRQRYEITFEKVASDLKTIRDAALADGSFGAAVTAELGRAKLAGLIVDRKEVKYGKIDQMDRKEVEARLRNLMEQNKIGNVEKDVTPEPEVIAHDGVDEVAIAVDGVAVDEDEDGDVNDGDNGDGDDGDGDDDNQV